MSMVHYRVNNMSCVISLPRLFVVLQARQAGFDFQKDNFHIICGVVNNTMIVDKSAGQIALQASGAMC